MKVKRSFLALFLALTMVFSYTAVPTSAKAKVKVKKVTVTDSITGQKSVTVAKGKSVKLATAVSVTPNKKANKGVSYKVASKKVATVSAKGVVKGKKAGSTKVTVTSKKDKKKKATIKIKVVKGAVSSVKLNKKSAKMTLGQKVTLKTTVKGSKGFSKTVAYATSKAKVAKVSNKGVITATGVGSATITVKAADGSGKKAACKVTVTNPINLAAMDVANGQTVTFALDKACALTPDKVVIKRKSFVNGTYNNTLTIQNFTTTDNVNYNVIVDTDSRIDVNEFVQVSIPSLTGKTKSLEKQYTEPACAFTFDEVSRWTVGEYNKDYFGFYNDKDYSYSQSGRGYSTYSISGVPAGLTAETKDNSLVVKGTPTTAGRFDATLTATDETGDTMTKTIMFIVGSDTVMAGAATASYAVLNADGANVYAGGSVVGGSGDYTYSIVGDTSGLAKIDTDCSGPCIAINSLKVAGDYTVTVRVTDDNNPALYCDIPFVIHAQQGITVGGCLKDAQGQPMNKGSIYFTNKNRADNFLTETYAYVNNQTATYSATIVPGTYDIKAAVYSDYDNAADTNYLYNQSITSSMTGFDVQLNLYKVVMTSADKEIMDHIKYTSWYIEKNEVGYGDVLYLKPGTYSIENTTSKYGRSENLDDGKYSTSGNWFTGITTTETESTKSYYKLTSAVTVANASVMAPVTKTVTKTEPGKTTTTTTAAAKNTTYLAYVDNIYLLSATNDYNAYKFTPSETATYEISNSSVFFYDANGTKLTAGENRYELTKGTTYYVSDDGEGDSSFKITKYEEPGTTEETPSGL